MTHDWFAHLEDARNDQAHIMASLGCATERVAMSSGRSRRSAPRNSAAAPRTRWRPALIADDAPAPHVQRRERQTDSRASPQDHAQLRHRVVGRLADLRLRRTLATAREARSGRPGEARVVPASRHGGAKLRYLPAFVRACPAGTPSRTATRSSRNGPARNRSAFADTWSIGMSFYHNVFAREHNAFVDEFRKMAHATPDDDSGLRNPADPAAAITYRQVSDEELFQVARLVVAAEIAKIHTIEWTTQLLYDEPLYPGMNSNWSGLFEEDNIAVEAPASSRASARVRRPGANQLYAAFSARRRHRRARRTNRYPALTTDWPSIDTGIVRQPGRRERRHQPFRLAVQLPRRSSSRSTGCTRSCPTCSSSASSPTPTRSSGACRSSTPSAARRPPQMHEGGLANWALTMGRQRLGLLLLRNHPQFLQNLDLRPRLDTTIDLAALDLIRDREHGVPRFNEFRRQIGLRQLTSFDDFIDRADVPTIRRTNSSSGNSWTALRAVYGQHMCDASKSITAAQRNRRRHADQRLPRPSERQHGRQYRGRRHGGRLPRRDDAPAWLCHLRDAVPHLHPQRLAPAVQRPLPHLELPARSSTRPSGSTG